MRKKLLIKAKTCKISQKKKKDYSNFVAFFASNSPNKKNFCFTRFVRNSILYGMVKSIIFANVGKCLEKICNFRRDRHILLLLGYFSSQQIEFFIL